MPFGLERLGLVPMGWGIDVTIWVAQHVSALPGDVWATPRLPAVGLLMISLGGLWLCLWRGPWRRWGHRCDHRRLRQHDAHPAARHRDCRWRALCRRAGGRRSLLRLGRQGREDRALVLRRRDRRGPGGLAGRRERVQRRARLRRNLCRYTARGRQVAIVTGEARTAAQMWWDRRDRQPSAGRLPLPLDDAGRRPHQLLAARRGRAVARPGGITVESANESRGDRPWVPHPRSARERSLPAVVDKKPVTSGSPN